MQRNKIVIKDLDFQNSKHVKSLRYLNCSVNKIERLLLIEQLNARNPILYPSIALKHSLFKKWLLQTKQPVFSTISKANCALVVQRARRSENLSDSMEAEKKNSLYAIVVQKRKREKTFEI